jgi:endo-1,4-beta-xylanase
VQMVPALKDVFAGCFRIGTFLQPQHFEEKSQVESALAKHHFNASTSSHVTNWDEIHPQPEFYNFDAADAFVAFCEKQDMFCIGHTLVWHNACPPWLFQDKAGHTIGKETLLKRMRDHIHTVVGRYKGRVCGWNVVNEAVDDNGSLRQSPWMKIIGEEYIAKAFEFAHEADPSCELYYNDYGLDSEPKRGGAMSMLQTLKLKTAHVRAVGMQGHYLLNSPSVTKIDETVTAFGKLGFKVHVSELDVDVLPVTSAPENKGKPASDPTMNPYVNGLPEQMETALAKRYAELFAVFIKHRHIIERVTFGNITDSVSWLNNFPIKGRTNHPLLFDRYSKPKPAFWAVVKLAEEKAKVCSFSHAHTRTTHTTHHARTHTHHTHAHTHTHTHTHAHSVFKTFIIISLNVKNVLTALRRCHSNSLIISELFNFALFTYAHADVGIRGKKGLSR